MHEEDPVFCTTEYEWKKCYRTTAQLAKIKVFISETHQVQLFSECWIHLKKKTSWKYNTASHFVKKKCCELAKICRFGPDCRKRSRVFWDWAKSISSCIWVQVLCSDLLKQTVPRGEINSCENAPSVTVSMSSGHSWKRLMASQKNYPKFNKG